MKTALSAELADKQQRLLAALRACIGDEGRLLVAYSGGVDSAYLAYAAHIALGDRMRAVIADSPSLPRKELAAAVALAEREGIPLRVIATQEMQSDAYRRNDEHRCFHCKDELFRVMQEVAVDEAAMQIAYGRNVDDAGDFRPGQRAAEQHAVLAPLVDAGLGKVDIRTLAEAAGLPVWNKAASACLASRIEPHREVTAEALAQVEAAEDKLHALGFAQVRVRHHGEIARIEIERSEMHRAFAMPMLDAITEAVQAAGFRFVTIDTRGYRSGSMNVLLPVEALLGHSASQAAHGA